MTIEKCEALKRIAAFVAVREKMAGTDPEVITESNGVSLLMSDLRAALSPAELGGVEEGVEAIQRLLDCAELAVGFRGFQADDDNEVVVLREAIREAKPHIVSLSTPRAAQAVFYDIPGSGGTMHFQGDKAAQAGASGGGGRIKTKGPDDFASHVCPAESAAVWNTCVYEHERIAEGLRPILSSTEVTPASPATGDHIADADKMDTPPAHGDGEGDVGLREVINSMEHDASDIRLGRQWMSACEHYLPKLRALTTRPTPEAQEARDAVDARRYRWLKNNFEFSFHRATCDYLVIAGETKFLSALRDENGDVTLEMDSVVDAALTLPAQGERNNG